MQVKYNSHEVKNMAISYAPLRSMMRLKKISWYQLANHGIDPQTLQRLRHDRPVSTITLYRLCQILDCQPGMLLEYSPDIQE